MSLISDVAVAIVAATVLAIVARALKQPLILAYLLAGIAVGPELGLGLVSDRESIQTIAEIGLILLLFIIGLEMDLQRLLGAGRTLAITGIWQFLACAGLGAWVAWALGFPLKTGRLDAAYVGIALALSSTMIVVKLLYDKNELATFPGRITIGVLVFQDVWAILVLAVQPTILSPSPLVLVSSFFKGGLLVVASLAASRVLLPRLFAFVAKAPELMLVTALAWCFSVSGAASLLGLSREMGALIAGIGMSTFPYNLDVIAKVTNIRDFFVTLFFVALGMQITVPTASVVSMALALSLLLVASRFLTVTPALYLLGSGLRTSLLPAINLAQMSEFSLVIVSLGLALGHVESRTAATLTFVFALTSVLSTYMISHSHRLQRALGRLLARLGLQEGGDDEGEATERRSSVVFLGFFRDASSILHQIEIEEASGDGGPAVLPGLLVIDFNPQVIQELRRRAVACLYGDIASLETLQHAPVEHARVLVCTLTDSVLKGTTNLRLLQQLRRVNPGAEIVLAADTIDAARALYAAGAGFVYMPRIHSAAEMVAVIRAAQGAGLAGVRDDEIARLTGRNEVLA